MIPARTVRTEKRVRSPLGQVVKLLFILFNAFMLFWLVAGMSDAGKQIEGMSGVAKDGATIGTAIGAGLILAIWTMGAVILGMLTLLTRGQTVVIEEGGPDKPRAALGTSASASIPLAAHQIALVSCEACGNQLSSAAASCPACGHPVTASVGTTPKSNVYEVADESVGGISHSVQAWLTVAAIILIFAGGLHLLSKANSTGEAPATSAQATQKYAIDEAIEYERYTVNVTDVTSAKILRSTAMNALTLQESVADLGTLVEMKKQLAGPGALYVTVVYSVSNSAKTPLKPGDRPNFQLKDQNGVLLDPDIGKSSVEQAYFFEQKILSDLNPGMTETNLVVFEVSEAQFDPGTWKVIVNGEAVVSLASMKKAVADSSAKQESQSVEAMETNRPADKDAGGETYKLNGYEFKFIQAHYADAKVSRTFMCGLALDDPSLPRCKDLADASDESKGTPFVVVEYTAKEIAGADMSLTNFPTLELIDSTGRSASVNQIIAAGFIRIIKKNSPEFENYGAVFDIESNDFDPKAWKVRVNGQLDVPLARVYRGKL